MIGDDPVGAHRARQERDWSHDLVLGALQNLDEPVGTLIRSFPGHAFLVNEPDWLEHWFIELAARFRKGVGPNLATIVASAIEDGDLSPLAKEPVDSSLRLLSLRPIWFRGFRDSGSAIHFEADLVVVEGRNSSGKTSISEAIEWVFTGQLSRRTSGEHGHATELADCIANEFRPVDAATTVELVVAVDGKRLVLTRTLRKDYSTVASASPESELLVDGRSASKSDERELFDRLLAGVPPILMQHNLRRFVHDDPSSRRKYFERLLQIDELTSLIEKAVMGPKRVREIPNPTGGTGLASLRDLAKEVENGREARGGAAAKTLRNLDRSDPGAIPRSLKENLTAIADEFLAHDVEGGSGLASYRKVLEQAQQRQRESRLPLLASLEAAKANVLPNLESFGTAAADLGNAVEKSLVARRAAAKITESQQEIARAVDQLLQIGAIDAKGDQECPVCENGTLTRSRVEQVVSLAPLSRAVETAASQVTTARVTFEQAIERLKQAVTGVAPPETDAGVAEVQLESVPQRVRDLGRAALESACRVRGEVADVGATINSINAGLETTVTTDSDVRKLTKKLEADLREFNALVTGHRQDVENLAEAVGAVSRDDAEYRLREKWLKTAGLTAAIAEDVAWEGAKEQARAALGGLREGLIELRTQIVEDARRTFSEEMTEVWGLLRQDSGAHFSQLRVPPARGKGFKLEFELKAVISDGTSDSEVDALRVFSESQVNAVGIAAYVTRASRLGHRLLIFDDPVQSMDEEHFRSFAANLLPTLLEDGHQVIVLTHNDGFAACVNDHHFQRESYATLSTRASKRKGCCVDEGSRRVSERLKAAEKAAQDGNLQGAWRLIRLAMERMYTLVKANGDESFDPQSWRNLTAEDMWNRGVADLVEESAPGHGRRLKEILVGTVAGTHDKPATSETDVVAAVRDLRSLLAPLRLGSG